MYIKIVLRNAKRQMGNYLIYFLTVMLTVALMFSINNLIYSENLKNYTDTMVSMKKYLQGLSVVIAVIVALIHFIYGKLRKREFGTYLTLAMLTGMVLGLFLYQCMMMLMSKLMEMEFASAVYLRKVSIYELILIYPDTKKGTGRTVRHCTAWVIAALVALVGMVAACIVFGEGLQKMNDSVPSAGDIWH